MTLICLLIIQSSQNGLQQGCWTQRQHFRPSRQAPLLPLPSLERIQGLLWGWDWAEARPGGSRPVPFQMSDFRHQL